ncbi:MAG: DUF3891 family protein [Acidobacteriota bacterium]
MIIAPAPPRSLRVVTQTDHAALAAEILRFWRADGVPTSPHRDALLFAAREHDNGWREVDAAPRTRDDGRPHDFRSMPEALRIELWNQGVARHAASADLGTADPEIACAAALIAHHAIALHLGRVGPQWEAARTDWTARRDELLAASGLQLEELEHLYRFVDLTDMVSLAACAGWTQRIEHRGVVIAPQEAPDAGDGSDRTTVALDPFPLAGATTFEVDARTIEDRAYAGDAELAVSLASAPRWRLRVRLVELR